ncbi:hypothetical protein Cgig2_016328 [Carnegiea gigantea]|uniref:Signal recognition particle 19 kDa protein n=1 Tax=Carnegiea gigantea TaxID=171969 RepID=A0A9Q1JQR7_9CARY|nr:hypothetical protein Cgig2_016328 [Carnegiea gigantea]
MNGELPNVKKWMILYPVYINSKKTIAEGRRISASKACENPTLVEIGDSCKHLNVPYVVEPDKAYPRDFMQRGRVRVLLKGEDGTLMNPEIPSSKRFSPLFHLLLICSVRGILPSMSGAVLYKSGVGQGTSSNSWRNIQEKQLMLRIAELVPRHHGRTKKQEPASSSSNAPAKSGKGGRKKK